jgi:hypothetical protein
LPYRNASWHLWRDHRVFVPFATMVPFVSFRWWTIVNTSD